MPTKNLCAIHQPNFFPRLSTLAKLYRADTWVVLDDVQYNSRDYQHRCRLGHFNNPEKFQWLSLPVHRPSGRVSLITDIQLVDQRQSYHRVAGLLHQHYRPSPHWPAFRKELQPVLDCISETASLAAICEMSTLVLLQLLGWRGQVVRSSQLPSRSGRSDRLADLVQAVGGTSYLCGTGGRRYLDTTPFEAAGLPVQWFEPPVVPSDTLGLWTANRQVSALWPMLAYGVDAVHAAQQVALALWI
jgi:WbqC-like protein family